MLRDNTRRLCHLHEFCRSVDIRHVRETELFGKDFVWGVTTNNNPTISDIWNSTPAWRFPYAGSRLAPAPVGASLIDGGLRGRVAGLGNYVLWNDLLYLEADVYKGLEPDALSMLKSLQ